MIEEKKYQGYGYHGGGRPRIKEEDKKIYKTISISGTPEQIEAIKKAAKDNNKTVSKFIIDSLTI